MKTLGVVRWEEFQLLLSQRVGESLSPEWAQFGKGGRWGIRELHILVLACEDLRLLCAGSPKIELKEKRLLKNVHLSGREDFGVIMFYRYVDFTWHSSS